MSEKWKIVKDDKSHWHYEKVETGCCEFWQEVKECRNSDCISFNDGVPVRWHALFVCPSCRDEGILVSELEMEMEKEKENVVCETG